MRMPTGKASKTKLSDCAPRSAAVRRRCSGVGEDDSGETESVDMAFGDRRAGPLGPAGALHTTTGSTRCLHRAVSKLYRETRMGLSTARMIRVRTRVYRPGQWAWTGLLRPSSKRLRLAIPRETHPHVGDGSRRLGDEDRVEVDVPDFRAALQQGRQAQDDLAKRS